MEPGPLRTSAALLLAVLAYGLLACNTGSQGFRKFLGGPHTGCSMLGSISGSGTRFEVVGRGL